MAGPYEPQTGTRAVSQLFSRAEPPTALLIANHEAAFGALPALVERRIDVPKQVSVIVYEDAPWFAYWGPPLTVVDNQPTALANAAVSLLLSRLHHEPEAGQPEAGPGAPGQQAHRSVILRESAGGDRAAARRRGNGPGRRPQAGPSCPRWRRR